MSTTRVTLVDDDASVLMAMERLLTAASFDVTTYGSARDFLASLPSGRPHCLVLDLHMPDLTGLDLQHHLVGAGITIPTIIITSNNERGIRERCQAAGAAAFLIKPLSGAGLVSAITAAVGAGHQRA
jgi:FixJ family two-component response regulator